MELDEQFHQAVTRSKELTSRPSNESLLTLYALYKQAIEGNTSGVRPGGFDFKAIAKFDAWTEKKDLPKEEAMIQYIQLVTELHQQNG